MEKIRVVIGDWSEDGYNQSDEFIYSVNKTQKELQDGYKASCKLTGVWDSNLNVQMGYGLYC